MKKLLLVLSLASLMTLSGCNSAVSTSTSTSGDSTSISVSTEESTSTSTSDSTSVPTKETVTVTFMNDEGTEVLDVQEIKIHGIPTYNGSLPFRASENEGFYWAFTGWSKNLKTFDFTEDTTVYPDFEIHTELTDGVMYELNEDGISYTLSSYYGDVADLELPWYYKNKPVTTIGISAFSSLTTLTSVTVPVTYTSIAYGAFNECTALELFDCYDSKIVTVAGYAFLNCTALIEANFPKTLKTLGEYAFSGCISVTTIELPKTTEEIGAYCFANFYELVDFTLPTSLTKLEEGTFYECRRIKTLEVTEDVKSIGDKCFYNNRSLTKVNIPLQVTAIGVSVFHGCITLPSINIPYGLTSIGTYAFFNCYALGAVDLLNSADTLTSIGSGAFSNCSALSRIIVPSKVTNIPSYFVNACDNLSYVEMRGKVTSIGQSAFDNCPSLKSLTIPETVTTIGEYAFRASGITTFTFGNSVSSMGDSAFADNTSVTNVRLPNGLAAILDYSFYNCTSLVSVTIPTSVKTINQFAFAGTSLTELNLNKVERLNSWSLREMAKLTSDGVTLPSTLTFIGTRTFFKDLLLANSTISYLGTMAQFNSIEKEEDWANINVSESTKSYISAVECSDGTITL